MTDSFKKFVSEDEIEKKRQERQNDWEKVRKPDDPLECPEEEVCNKTLFEQLETQRLSKQDEIDEKFKLKNQVRGLDEGESEFLDYVSDRQVELQKKRQDEDNELISEYKKTVSNEELDATRLNGSKKTEKKTVRPQIGASQSKSQSALLSGAIKRKSVEKNGLDEKKMKVSETENHAVSHSSVASYERTNPDVDSGDSNPGLLSPSNQTAQVLAILPGIGEYTSDDSSDSVSSCSDSDIETDAFKEEVQVPYSDSACDHAH